MKFIVKVIPLFVKVFWLCHAFDSLSVIVALYRNQLINLAGFYMRGTLILKGLKTRTRFSFRSSHSQKFFRIGIIKFHNIHKKAPVLKSLQN